MRHELEFRRTGRSLLFAAILICVSARLGAETPPSPTPSDRPAAKTPASPTAKPGSGKAAAKTPAAPTPPPTSGTPAAKTPAAKASAAPTAQPRSGNAAPAGTPHAKPLEDAVHSQDVVGGLKKPASDCGRSNEFLTKALEMNRKGLFDAALELAERVEYDPKCDFPYLQACGLMAGIYVFETKDYEKGIAAAKKGLALDSRQTSLWYSLGYAQYQVDSFAESAEAFRKVLQHSPVVPLPESALTSARYLLSDSVDRNSMLKGLSSEEQATRMSEAITVWQEYQDFCQETPCEEVYLTHASARITELRQQLQLLRFKTHN
jgi:tetratricopeptide (TPR) repeat protein